MPESRKTPILAIIIALAAAGALLITLTGGSSEDDSPVVVTGESSGDSAFAELHRRDPDDPMAMGAVDAPVVMVEYSEFQCPFCGRFARDTAPTLIDEYVDEGLLRIEFRDFPYLGPDSDVVAKAARAAGEQGKFWEFHDLVFANQLPPNSGQLDRDYLLDLADQAGLDTEQFLADLESEEFARAINRDRNEGLDLGVTGTPAFFINDQLVMGAQPTDVFVDVIEAALEKSRE